MAIVFSIALLVCLAGAVIAEILTIAAPHRILGISDIPPNGLMKSAFYRMLMIFSGQYIAAIILMFLSGNDTFRRNALILVTLSFSAWLIRKILLRLRLLQITESTLCLIFLIDTGRTVVRGLLQ